MARRDDSGLIVLLAAAAGLVWLFIRGNTPTPLFSIGTWVALKTLPTRPGQVIRILTHPTEGFAYEVRWVDLTTSIHRQIDLGFTFPPPLVIFKVGDRVRLKSAPTMEGVITIVFPVIGEIRTYEVLFDLGPRIVMPDNDLELAPVV